MEEGELQRFLDEEESIKEKDVIRLMRQILSAVQFLHNNNIAHLDIKVSLSTIYSPLPSTSALFTFLIHLSQFA
jgi:death associated protein kinase, putative